MAQRKVIWTETAAKQRKAILSSWYDRNQSVSYPLKLIKLLNTKISLIKEHPLEFPRTSFPDTRVSTIGNFSLFYKADEERIIITAFWNNRQEAKRLKKLIEK